MVFEGLFVVKHRVTDVAMVGHSDSEVSGVLFRVLSSLSKGLDRFR